MTGVSVTAAGTTLYGCPCACTAAHVRILDHEPGPGAVPALIPSLERQIGARGSHRFGEFDIAGLGRYMA